MVSTVGIKRGASMMIEVWAAIAGAAVSVVGIGVTGINRQTREGQDSLIRLTTAVDNLSSRLDMLHRDIKATDSELTSRLNNLERAVARMEGHGDRH